MRYSSRRLPMVPHWSVKHTSVLHTEREPDQLGLPSIFDRDTRCTLYIQQLLSRHQLYKLSATYFLHPTTSLTTPTPVSSTFESACSVVRVKLLVSFGLQVCSTSLIDSKPFREELVDGIEMTKVRRSFPSPDKEIYVASFRL